MMSVMLCKPSVCLIVRYRESINCFALFCAYRSPQTLGLCSKCFRGKYCVVCVDDIVFDSHLYVNYGFDMNRVNSRNDYVMMTAP